MIIERVEWLAAHPEALRFPLRHMPSDLKGLHKYRAGDYRILLWVDRQREVLTLYGVAHRRDVYRGLR
jgi:mRNA-degrading endonuclease RelE of RelBE toxin-antitoxin system